MSKCEAALRRKELKLPVVTSLKFRSDFFVPLPLYRLLVYYLNDFSVDDKVNMLQNVLPFYCRMLEKNKLSQRQNQRKRSHHLKKIPNHPSQRKKTTMMMTMMMRKKKKKTLRMTMMVR